MADQDFKIKVVTTADTSGIRQTSADLDKLQRQQATFTETARREAAAKASTPAGERTEQVGASLTRSFTAAAGFGYIVAQVINGITKETNKVTEELDKQGAHLVDLSHKWTEMAQAATSAEDIAKIAASGTKEIDALGKAIIKSATPDFSLGQTIVDNLVKRFKNLGRETEDALGPNEELANALFEGLQRDQQQLIEMNARAIELGRTFEKSFEKRQAESLADAIAEIGSEMAKAKNEQDALTGAMLRTKGGIDRYNELAQTIANLTRQTDLLTAADAKRQRQAEASAKAAEKEASEKRKFQESALETSSPQAKAILAQEEAAKRARAQGDEISAAQFEKSAEAFKRGATPEQLAEAEQLSKAATGGEARPGRKAGVGESQELVDQIERNRIAAEKQRVEQGTGGPSKTGNEAIAARLDEMIRIQREQIGIWR